MTNNQSKK